MSAPIRAIFEVVIIISAYIMKRHLFVSELDVGCGKVRMEMRKVDKSLMRAVSSSRQRSSDVSPYRSVIELLLLLYAAMIVYTTGDADCYINNARYRQR